MRNASGKDIWRSIKNSRKRFLSLLLITALGVTVLTGIYAACKNLYYSADRFYDEQNLFDLRVLSTLGLTQDDVDAFSIIDEIEQVEGAYSEEVHTEVNDIQYVAQMNTVSPSKMNSPYIEAGYLPKVSGEIAVTKKYLEDTGKKVGDSVTIEEVIEDEDSEEVEERSAESEGEIKGGAKVKDEVAIKGQEATKNQVKSDTSTEFEEIDWDAEVEIEEDEETPNFLITTYKITGIVIDPMDISGDDTGFRSSATAADYTFYISPLDVESDLYTCVYITLAGMEGLDCYSAEYENIISNVVHRIENEIKTQREQARYDFVIADATGQIKDAETTMNEKFAEVDIEFANGKDKIADARQEIRDGEAELTKQEAEAIQKIADARAEISTSKEELTQAERDLVSGAEKLQQGREELDSNAAKLAQGKQQLAQEKQTAEEGFASAEQTMTDKQSQLDGSRTEISAGVEQMRMLLGEQWPTNEWNALVNASTAKSLELLANNPNGEVDVQAVAEATAVEQTNLATAILSLGAGGIQEDNAEDVSTIDYTQISASSIQSAIGLGILDAGQQMLDAGKATFEEEKAAAFARIASAENELASNEAQLEAGGQELESAQTDLDNGKIQIADGWNQLNIGEIKLNEEEATAQLEIADARQEITDGKKELSDNEIKLKNNETKYLEKKQEAKEKIADAYLELDDIDMTQWYVQDRNSLDSYSSLKSDLSSIESIGNVFPILFLVVAILISLTTMTRMIEEERGFIGTYKALGYSNGAIYGKYAIYAALACILGGLLGDVLGFIALPKLLLLVLQTLYTLPNVYMRFDWLYGIGGIVLFMLGITGATVLACRNELRQMPAALMRPKAPKNGTRIFLERFPFIWNRLKFLNKVTIRNLFRYKKRFLMTVFGIMGCTALVIAGFAIKDSVKHLIPSQYEDVYQYDFMTVVDEQDNEALLDVLSEDTNIADYRNIQVDSMKLVNQAGSDETIQLMVVANEENLDRYIQTIDINGKTVPLNDSGVLITQNAAVLLGIEVGDTVTLQNSNLERREVAVSHIVENYLGNNVYMKQNVYESMFEEYAPNAALAHFSKECSDPVAYAEEFSNQDMVLSSVSVQELKDNFVDKFGLINAVVYVIIALAAGLAFVVLFTLSNTNISERIRELATTKVLGFYDREVYSYVNKETLILTGIGILVGLPVGRFLSGLLTSALQMPSIYFAAYVAPISYVYAIGLSLCFAVIVNLITNRILNKINMVEALKSVE